jgi:hypothetical protein
MRLERRRRNSMQTRKSGNPRLDALPLAKNIKSIRSYVDDGAGWVEILFKDNYELAIRFEVAVVVKKASWFDTGGNSRLIKRYKILKESRHD